MLAFYTPKISFSVNQLSNMLILQGKANDVMSDAWRTSCNCTIQYYRAAWTEAAEAINHHGWKWWKKTDCDMNQLKLELIDIIHFALSHKFREFIVNELGENTDASNIDMSEMAYECASQMMDFDATVTLEQIGKYASDDAYEKLELKDGEIDIAKFPLPDALELFIYNTLQCAEPDWATLMMLFDMVGETAQSVYDQYEYKNLLNIFRTSNGQRTNDYKKMWDGREDNEYLTDYRVQCQANGEEFSVDGVLAFLQDTYNQQLTAGTAVKA